jgi:hypothetical protein
VMARWYNDLPAANVTGGAAFSMVLDVGEWDNSLVLNMPGNQATLEVRTIVTCTSDGWAARCFPCCSADRELWRTLRNVSGCYRAAVNQRSSDRRKRDTDSE